MKAGGPGPSLLGIWDINTMQAITPIQLADRSMTPPLACLLSAAFGMPPHSTGKERDAESGNDYFGARYYASTMGRFLSPDWSAQEDPVPYAVLDDPQSLNLYSYVRNNPLSRTDPTGHCPWCLALAGGGVLADEAPLAFTGPVGWTVIGVTAVGVLGVAAYQHFHNDSSEPSSDASPAPPPKIIIDGSQHPESAQHAAEAQAAGHPKVVTINRPGAKGNRRAAQKGSQKQAGKHVDEYPPAVTQEGGAGASTKSIPGSDNSGAGASMGNQMRPYPDGTQVEIVPTNVPNPPPPPPQPTPKPQ
jgi:RHS repeat-associated protein